MTEAAFEPTKGEIVRRLEAIAQQQQQLLDEIRRDRLHVAETYVRKDVHVLAQQLQQATVSDMQTDIAIMREERKADVAWRRQVLLWLGGISVTLLVGIAGLIVSLVAK